MHHARDIVLGPAVPASLALRARSRIWLYPEGCRLSIPKLTAALFYCYDHYPISLPYRPVCGRPSAMAVGNANVAAGVVSRALLCSHASRIRRI